MGRRVREHDWARTPLGPIESWSQSLRVHVGMMIGTKFPMYIFWGPTNVALYNDGYSALIGDKHPRILGQTTAEVWNEVWTEIEPLVRTARSGEAVIVEDFPLIIDRYGSFEETYFTFCYSPLVDDDGEVNGALATVVETTRHIFGQRRLELIRDLAARTAVALTEAQTCERIAHALGASPDLAFAALYVTTDPGEGVAQLAARAGALPPDAPLPEAVTIPGDQASGEPDASAFAALGTIVANRIAGGDGHTIGLLVTAPKARLRADESFRQFIALLASHVGSAIAMARSLAEANARAEALQVTRTIEKIGMFAESGQQLFWITDAEGAVEWFNRSWYSYTGQTPAQAKGWGWTAMHHPDDVERVLREWNASLTARTPFEQTFRLRGADGTFRWFLTRAVPEFDDDGRLLRWYGSNTNIDAERRAAQQLDVLATLGEGLSRSLDRRKALAVLSDLLVPALADWTLINLDDGTGRLVLAAARHRDPRLSELLEPIIGTCYERPDGRSGAVRVFRTGRAEVIETITPAAASVNINESFGNVVRQIGLTSAIVVPIFSHGTIVGTFHALSSGTNKTYTLLDLPFYEEIGRRIGYAMQNADAYEREVRIAHSFQNAALPSTLPVVPALRFASLYEPASSDANVGGDFFDAFRLLDGRVVVSIGDVAGSGLAAAATMAALRQSIRAAARINPDPDLLLKAADGVFADGTHAAFASAFVAIVDPLSFSIQYASAGHPPALLRLPDGTLTRLGEPELLLGVSLPGHHGGRRVGRFRAPANSLLLLYTDGLIEATHDIESGERLLEAAVAALPIDRETVVGHAAAIHDTVLGTGHVSHDDVAMLSIFFDQPLLGADRDDVRSWTFQADDGDEAHRVRLAFVDALERAGLESDEIFSAEMVFSELVGNVVRYGGAEIDVILDLTQSSPVLHVIDGGEGFSLNPKLPVDSLAERGRGLYIVTQLAREFIVSPRTMHQGSHARVILFGIVSPVPSYARS